MISDNYFGPLTEDSRIEKLQVFINGIEIDPKSISDIQINYGRENKGVITFVDITGVSEAMPLTYGIIDIIYDDFASGSSQSTYIITRVNTTRYKDNTIKQTCFFENLVLNNLKTLYVSKAYSNMKVLDIIHDIFIEYDIDADFIISNDDKIYENFVIPKNISFWEWMNKQSKFDDFEFYFDFNGLRVLSKVNLSFTLIPESEGNSYILGYHQNNEMFNILEFSGITSNTEELNKIPTSNRNKFDVMDLKYNPDVIGISSAYVYENVNKYIGIGEVTLDSIYSSIGTREIDNLNNNLILGQDENYRDILNKNQFIKIAVQGMNVNRLYSKIKINIPSAKAENNDYNKVYSGHYIITEVVNRIISGVFIQILTLQVSDYERGSTYVWK
jgi:hypothetical protein